MARPVARSKALARREAGIGPDDRAVSRATSPTRPTPDLQRGDLAKAGLARRRPAGLVRPGNINLHNRPVVHNPDGTISTVRSITITHGGRAILLPTVVGGKVVSPQEAIDHWRRTHEHLGIFSDEASANSYAEALHKAQAKEYGPKPKSAPSRPVTGSGQVTEVGGRAVPKREWNREAQRIDLLAALGRLSPAEARSRKAELGIGPGARTVAEDQYMAEPASKAAKIIGGALLAGPGIAMATTPIGAPEEAGAAGLLGRSLVGRLARYGLRHPIKATTGATAALHATGHLDMPKAKPGQEQAGLAIPGLPRWGRRAAKAALDVGIYSGPAVYEMGKAGVQDTGAALHGDRSFGRSRKLGKEIGKSIAQGAEHPLRPENFVQNALLGLGGLNLLAHGVERVRARTPLHTPAPGETTLKMGGLKTTRLEPDAPILRHGHRLRTAWLNKRLAKPEGQLNTMAPGRAENTFAREKAANQRVAVAAEKAHADTLRRAIRRFTPAEHMASDLISIEGDRALSHPGEVVARHAAKHRQWAEEGIDSELNLQTAHDIEQSLGVLMNPPKKFLRAVELGRRLSQRSESQQIARGLVDAEGAQVRKASIAEVYGRGHGLTQETTRSRTHAEAQARLDELDASYEELVAKAAHQLDPMDPKAKQLETLWRNRARGRLYRGKRLGKIPTVNAELRSRAEGMIAQAVERNPSLPAARLLRERDQLRARMNQIGEASMVGEKVPGGKEGLRALYEHGREIQPQFENFVAAVAGKTGARFIPGELKPVRRAMEKVRYDYAGDASLMKDVVRGRVVVDNAGQLRAVLDELKVGGRVVGVRNYLDKPSEAGFRDAKVLVDVGGHISEISILPREVFAAYRTLRPKYKRYRELVRDFARGRQVDVGELEALRAEMTAGYDAALGAFLERSHPAFSDSKAAGSIRRPSTSDSSGKGRPPGRSKAVASRPETDTGISSYSQSPSNGPAFAPLFEGWPTPHSLQQPGVPSFGVVSGRELIHPSGPGLGIGKPPEGSFYVPRGSHFKLPTGKETTVRAHQPQPGQFGLGPVEAGRGQHGALRHFTGEGEKHGRPPRPLEAIAEAFSGRQIGYSATDLYHDALRASTDRKTTPSQVAIRPTRKTLESQRRELAAAAEKARTGDQTALVRAFEKIYGELVIPGSETAEVGTAIPGVRWVDSALLKPTHSRPSQGPLAAVAHGINRPARAVGVFLRPAYYATNRLGNETMGIFLHGPKAFSVGTSTRMGGLGPEAKGVAESVAGTSRTQSYLIGARANQYAGRNPVRKALGQTGRAADRLERMLVGGITGATDRSFRLRMFEIRAAQRGYHGKEALQNLLMSEDPKVRADLIAVGRRSRRDAVDFDSLAPSEKQIAEAFYFYPWTSRAFAWTGRSVVNRPLTSGTIAAAAPIAQERQPDWLKKGPNWLHGYIATKKGVLNAGPVWTPATVDQTVQSAVDVGKGLAGAGKPGSISSFAKAVGTPALQLAGGETIGGLLGTSGAGAVLRRAGVVTNPAIVGRAGKTFPETGWKPALGSFVFGGLFPRQADKAFIHQSYVKNLPPERRAVVHVFDKRNHFYAEAKRLGLIKTKDGRFPRDLRRAFSVEALRQAGYARASAGIAPGTREYQAARFHADVEFLLRFGAIDKAGAAKGIAKGATASRDELKGYRDYIRNHYYAPGWMDTISEARRYLKKHGAQGIS